VKKTVLVYAAALVVAVFVLEWVQFKYAVRAFSTEWFVVFIAIAFTALGAWLSWRLTPKSKPASFERNDKAIESLSLTPRELEVLYLLSQGQSNKEAARNLDLAPNTVKTHIASVFRKLEVSRRTQAIKKAQSLSIIP